MLYLGHADGMKVPSSAARGALTHAPHAFPRHTRVSMMCCRWSESACNLSFFPQLIDVHTLGSQMRQTAHVNQGPLCICKLSYGQTSVKEAT